MKFPKLKNTVWCMICIYAPVVILLFLFFFVMFLDSLSDELRIILFLAVAFVTLFYIIKNFALLFVSELIFSTISSWKKDRTVFESSKNGNSRREIEENIFSRCNGFGTKIEPVRTSNIPLSLRNKHGISFHEDYSSIEKTVAIFSTERLNKELFHSIMYDAKAQFAAVPVKKKKAKKNSPRPARAMAVIILSDTVDDGVGELARKTVSDKNGCFLPCVVDCRNGKYYFDNMAEPYISGISGKPEKNYAISIIKKIVFNGKIPNDKPENRPALESDEFNPEMTLWEFISNLNKDIKNASKGAKKELKDMFNNLADGEVSMGEYGIYCKLNDKLTCWSCYNDDEEHKLMVTDNEFWDMPKTKQIGKEDYASVKNKIESFLSSNGYDYAFEEYDED